MREVNLGDLSFGPNEQELLERVERAAQRQDASRFLPSFAVGAGTVLALWLGSSMLGPNQPTPPALLPQAAAGTTEPAVRMPRQARAAEAHSKDTQGLAAPAKAYAKSGGLPRVPYTRPPTHHSVLVDSVNPWTATHILVHKNDVLTIQASGTMHPCSWNNCLDKRFERWVDARGFVDLPYLFGFPSMALVGRVGESGQFFVGNSVRFVSPSDGILYLGVNDIPMSFSDNSGRLTVSVTVSSRPD